MTDTATATGTAVQVWVPSEYHPLEVVVMCQANPWRAPRDLPDTALLRQLLRNNVSRYDVGRVREQQQEFARVLSAHGATVLWAEPLGRIVSQHYTRDVAFAVDSVLVVARPRRRERQRELPGLNRLLPQLSRVVDLDQGTIEGGDVLVDHDHVIVGLGEETDPTGVQALRRRLDEEGVDREIVVLELSTRGAIHTDTLFTVVAPGLGLVCRRWFTPAALRWLDDHYDLIEVDGRRRRELSVNTFSINPNTVVVSAADPVLVEQLTDRGLQVIPLDYSEVTKLPGSFRCTTMPVRRTPDPTMTSQ